MVVQSGMFPELTLGAVVRAVLGGADGACRLCLRAPAPGRLRLSDEVLLGHPHCPPSLSLADIVVAVTGVSAPLPETEDIRSQYMCKTCARAAVDAYVFQQYCRGGESMWGSVRRALASLCLPELAHTHNRTFFILLDGETARVVEGGAGRVSSAQRAAKRLSMLVRRRRDGGGGGGGGERAAPLMCARCGRLFSREHLLRRHAAAAYCRRDLACGDCPRTFASRSKLNVHRDRAHTHKTVTCGECPRRFASAFLAEEHRKAMHAPGSCRVCGKRYTSRKGLRDHETSHALQFSCPCGKLYKYREGLRLHTTRCPTSLAASAAPPPAFVCDHCGKSYAFKHTLQQHIQYSHSARPLACDACGKKFLNASVLRNHLAVHTGRKNYSCVECGGTFMSSTTLVYHVRAKHSGERPYPCDVCGETFITSFRRTEHARRRHGAPGPVCLLCRRTFTNLACLRRHARRCHPADTSTPPAGGLVS